MLPKMSKEDIRKQVDKLGAGWQAVAWHHLHKEFKFADFASALEFANKVGAIAAAADHHPDILISWGKAIITLWTHTVDGITTKDFKLAKDIDGI